MTDKETSNIPKTDRDKQMHHSGYMLGLCAARNFLEDFISKQDAKANKAKAGK